MMRTSMDWAKWSLAAGSAATWALAVGLVLFKRYGHAMHQILWTRICEIDFAWSVTWLNSPLQLWLAPCIHGASVR